MLRITLLTAILVTTAVFAAEDLTVLKPEANAPSPRKMLNAYLVSECDKHFAARKAEVEKLKTPADVSARQTALRAKFIEALGGFPDKTPLKARTVGTLPRDGYRIEKVIYESRPEHHVTANLYLPEGKGPFPGVLMPLGHSQNGKAAEYMQHGAILLAKNGIAALVYDPIGQGERSQLLDKLGNPAIKGSTSEHTMCGIGALLVGRSTASYRIWDGIRSLDYLASRPEIDAKKLGCTGCSGGGTLTAYLMALDDRILAAAPSCYITSLERLFKTLGPQDAEQNITGQVAFGLDHSDYIALRAPKPTIILASTRDFFDITGTWNTFREAKKIYTLLGLPERLDIIEADEGHGYPKSHRQAMARFMSRWLKGEDKVIVEGDNPIEKDADLRCTRSGQVLEDFKGKSVFDLNASLATEFAKARAGKTWEREALRKEVARLIGLPKDLPALTVRDMGTVEMGEVEIHKWLYSPAGGVPLPALSDGRGGDHLLAGLTVHVHERGAAAAIPPGAIPQPKLAVDLRGYGETAPAVAGKSPVFGVDVKEAFLSIHLNRPLLGQRVTDLLGVLGTIEEKGTQVVGVGSAAVVALHAAVLSEKVRGLVIRDCLVSWDNVVRTPISQNQLANVVPGALMVYDLPDLMAAMAPRHLAISHPVDSSGKPLTREAAEQAFRPVREAYKKANAERNFTVVVTGK